MENKEIFERISSDPDILHGKPCINGTRIPVYLIVSLVAEGRNCGGYKLRTILPLLPGILRQR